MLKNAVTFELAELELLDELEELEELDDDAEDDRVDVGDDEDEDVDEGEFEFEFELFDFDFSFWLMLSITCSSRKRAHGLILAEAFKLTFQEHPRALKNSQPNLACFAGTGCVCSNERPQCVCVHHGLLSSHFGCSTTISGPSWQARRRSRRSTARCHRLAEIT